MIGDNTLTWITLAQCLKTYIYFEVSSVNNINWAVSGKPFQHQHSTVRINFCYFVVGILNFAYLSYNEDSFFPL